MKLSSRDGAAVRVLLATLNLTNVGERVDFDRIAIEAQSTEKSARTNLSSVLGLSGQHIKLSSERRLRLAMEIARVGQLGAAARVLSWREFEKFAENCMEEAGFEARRNVRVKGEGRTWEIDVIGFRGELVLAIDCKHWNTPSYLSRLKPAASHQRHAISHLLKTLEDETSHEKGRQALAVILTLREPPAQFFENTVLVSIEKLPSFLSSVTPYDEDLPFISSPVTTVENPMSQSR